MKVKFLVASSVVVTFFIVLWVYGNSVIVVGERESRWITQDMWEAGYFNARSDGFKEYERVNLLSLQEGSSKSQELVTYVVRNKCEGGSERCYVIMTSASNLLVDGGEFDSGLRGMVEAFDRVKTKGVCPIVFESAILKYKLKVLSSKGAGSARNMSRDILERIELKGGFLKNLRTESCNRLSKARPEYFHNYVVLVASVMEYAGGDIAKAGVYINYSTQYSGVFE